MGFALQTSSPILTFSPGTGIIRDAEGAFRLDLAALAAGADFSVTASDPDGSAFARYRISVVEEPLTVVTRFDSRASLADLGFVATAAPAWTLGDGFARLVPAASARAHGDWAGAGGDGLYRCLFRVKGGLAAALDRRVTFGARVRLVKADWFGARVEIFETTTGDRRIHIRDYTGSTGVTASLATTPVAWSYDRWQWLEAEVVGTTVRGRIYAEGAAVPGWQVEATTRHTEPGAFGPGGFPAAGLSPTIDIRALEFTPA